LAEEKKAEKEDKEEEDEESGEDEVESPCKSDSPAPVLSSANDSNKLFKLLIPKLKILDLPDGSGAQSKSNVNLTLERSSTDNLIYLVCRVPSTGQAVFSAVVDTNRSLCKKIEYQQKEGKPYKLKFQVKIRVF
jgi:hypothetical protein